MANIRSAKKRIKTSAKRREYNKAIISKTKTANKNFENAVTAGDAETAENKLQVAVSILDKSVVKGILHHNNVARKKSRMAKKLAGLKRA